MLPSYSIPNTLFGACTMLRTQKTVRIVYFTVYKRYLTESTENINAGHARFIAEAPKNGQWDAKDVPKKETTIEEDLHGVRSHRGKLSSTSSHLFKLILPLPDDPFPSTSSSSSSSSGGEPEVPKKPIIFLLHPSQPLSHLSRLIAASFPSYSPEISFESAPSTAKQRKRATLDGTGADHSRLSTTANSAAVTSSSASPGTNLPLPQGGDRDDLLVTRRSVENGGARWSDSTDVGDFIKEAAQDTEFLIIVKPTRRRKHGYDESSSINNEKSSARFISSEDSAGIHKKDAPHSTIQNDRDNSHDGQRGEEYTIRVQVPSFADRTHFLRARLEILSTKLCETEELKRACDREAHRGARRMALGGFGALVVYWGTVARLTFWDVGWDVMEPVTYLSGLSTVICGYLWFLYQGREVSYTSVLSTSISSRRQALYTARGFDADMWLALREEKMSLAKEISKIAVDYDVGWKEGDEIARDVFDKDESVHLSEEKSDLDADRNGIEDGLESAGESTQGRSAKRMVHGQKEK